MTTSRLKVEDSKMFSDVAMAFFAQTTGHKAAVRTAYMLDGAETVVWNDFQGRIALSENYLGSVPFSAPRELLTHLLLKMVESSYTASGRSLHCLSLDRNIRFCHDFVTDGL